MKYHFTLPFFLHNRIPANFNIIENKGKPWPDCALILILFSSIIFFLTLKGWTNTCLFLLLIPSLFYFKKNFQYASTNYYLKFLLPVCLSLLMPIIAIFISQLGRQDWLLRAYDGPSRMLFCVPLLLYLTHKKISFSRLLFLASPLTLIITFFSVHLHPEFFWSNRFTTKFVDPNSLGIYSVLFTSFCLIQLTPSLIHQKKWFFYHLIGVFTGLHLAIGSGTRSSLIVIPFILIIWFFLNSRKLNFRFVLIILPALILSILAFPYFSPEIVERFNMAYLELLSWLDHSNVDTSIGIRLSMWEMSWHLFLHDPFFGYGDKGFAIYLNEPWLNSSASPMAKSFFQLYGAHNELIANALRSGIFGIISFLCLLLTPLTFFIKNISNLDPDTSMAAQLGIVFITCLAISSIGLEIFNLKYTSSFYGLIISGLVAQICSAQTIHKNNT